ncbi:MAG: arsenate reductase ArsC [Thermomicrobiales bacterium]
MTEDKKIRVLFLCTHNSARSQMAEALLRHHGGGDVEVHSAGSEPGQVHPLAVRAMAESGVNISGAESKHLDQFIGQNFDYVITVCDRANETCPVFPGDPKRIHWSFDDPSAAAGLEEERFQAFRDVRNLLNMRLQNWLLAVNR